MNHEEIISTLQMTLNKNGPIYKTAVEKTAKYRNEIAETMFLEELSVPVKAVLEKQDEFKEPLYVYGGSMFGIFLAATKLIHKALETRNPKLALDWLEKVISTGQTTGLKIMVIWGLTVQNTVSLTQEVDLVPIDELPESIQKDQLMNYQTSLHSYNSLPSRLPIEKPKTALIYRMTVKPPISHHKEIEKLVKNNIQHYEHLNNILHALALVGPCAPIPYVSWFQFEDNDFEYAQISSGTSFGIPEIQPYYLKTLGPFNPETAKQVVKQYLELEGTTKKRVQIALERLHQSIIRRQVGDQAMEISIALESILGEGITEKIYRVGLRTALLLGGLLTDGLNNRGVVESVYTLRSRLVHEGEVSYTVKVRRMGKGKPKETVKAKDIVDEGIVICAKVIRRILELGEIPEWTEFELTHSLTKD